jgi:ribonuclease BN (tRNA processing enzyme)
MRLIPLGTNGFFSSFGRETACFAIPYKKTLILLDAGTGLFRLAEPIGKKLLSDINAVHLYLSHYHLDHTFGFYAAFHLLKDKKVTVFGSHRRQVFWEFVTLKYFPVDYAKKHKNFKWINLEEGRHKIADYQVSVRKQNHRGEVSLCYRFDFPEGKSLAYLTDGDPEVGKIPFVEGIDLLLHEHEPARKKIPADLAHLDKLHAGGHTTPEGAALIAREAQVGELVLIHHLPNVDVHELKKQLKVAKSVFPKTELAYDLQEINF